MNNITGERPLNVATMERYLLLANDAAGVSLKTVIRPSPTNRDASELTAIVEYNPVNAGFSVDNSGSKYTGVWMKTYSGSLNSPTGWGDKLTFSEVDGDPLQQFRLRQVAYSMPIGDDGLLINLGADHSTSRSGFTLAPLDVFTATESQNASLSYQIIRSRSENLTVEGGVKHKIVDTDVSEARFTTDKLAFSFLRASYDFSDSWNGSNVITAADERGSPHWAKVSNLDADSSRPEAKSSWDKYTMEVVRQQKFGDTGFGSTLGVNGQWTRSKLPEAEEFTVGGRDYGRGYDNGELIGDQGIASKAELTFTDDPHQWWMDHYQLYSFYDFGEVWTLDSVDHGTDLQERSLASAGIGLRTNIRPWIGLDFETAKPLTTVPGTSEDKSGSAKKAPRYFIAMRLSY